MFEDLLSEVYSKVHMLFKCESEFLTGSILILK